MKHFVGFSCWIVLLATAMGWGQSTTTVTLSGKAAKNLRIANSCELIGIDGRIYTLYEYYSWLYPGMELCVDLLPVVTRHPVLPLPTPSPHCTPSAPPRSREKGL